MAAKYLVLLATCLALTQATGELQTVNGKIKVSIGTMSGCGDTVTFIRDHLTEAYRLYKDFLEIEFVPWGRSFFESNGDITCRFGVNDCWANRLQRCVLDMLKGNQDAQVEYMTCEFTSPFPSFLQGSYVCAQAAGVNLINVDNCVTQPPGDRLDTEAAEATAGPMAVINFIPYIVFNDVVDLALHREALTRFRSMICFALAADHSTGLTASGCTL